MPKPAPEKGNGPGKKGKTGPEPELFKLMGKWKRDVKTALGKKRPKAGWPK
jgi:hypothetical protein